MAQFRSAGTLTPAQKKKIRHQIMEEKQGAKKYSKMGLKNLAKDERKHARYLKRFLK